MRRNRFLAVLVALVASLTAFTAAPATARDAAARDIAPAVAHGQPPHRSRTLPAADVQAIEQVVQTIVDQGTVGVTVVVDSPRGRLERSWGAADLTTGEALRPDHRHRIASITKTFVATAVLRLVDLGRVRLDDPIDRYVSGLPNGDRITVRQVLGMRSGLPDYTKDPELLDDFATDLTLPGWDEHRALDIIRNRPPTFAPDEKTVYNNSNYIVAGFLLERVTGLPAEWAIALLVNLPAWQLGSRFVQGSELPPSHARSYFTVDPPYDVTALNADAFWTAGAMTATAPDVARWIRQHARGSLLSRRTGAEQRTTTPFDATDLLGYGLGILRLGGWLGHDGYLPAYESFALHHADTDTTVVVIANSVSPEGPGAATQATLLIADRLVPGSIPSGPPAATAAVGRLGR